MHEEAAADGEDRTPKLAEKVAAAMTRDIIRRGWKVGEMLGSEPELVQRYKVSRWIMREAIGIAQHDGLVEIRRGRNGGIAVAAPALDTIGSSIRSFLEAGRVPDESLAEARILLEGLAMSLASARLDDEQIARLRAVSARAEEVTPANSLELGHEILDEILRASGNDILRVFAGAVAQVAADLSFRRGVTEDALREAGVTLVKVRRQQIDAIIAYDAERSAQLLREHAQLSASLLGSAVVAKGSVNRPLDLHLLDLSSALTSARQATDIPRRPKRTEEISRVIQADIIANNWPAGHLLGSEADLIRRFGVSRSVLRETIRPLERLGIVSMQGRPLSGLRVTRPDPQAIIRGVTLYLNYAKIPQRAIQSIMRVLELAAVSGAMTLDAAQRESRIIEIENAFDRGQQITVTRLRKMLQEFYFGFAQLTPNPVVSLFMRILAGAETIEWPSNVTGALLQKTSDGMKTRITALLEAIRANDETLARRRMVELRQLEVPFGVKLRSPQSLHDEEPT